MNLELEDYLLLGEPASYEGTCSDEIRSEFAEEAGAWWFRRLTLLIALHF